MGPNHLTLVALSHDGHVLAHQSTGPYTLPLRRDKDCAFFDPETETLWRADPSRFERGPRVVGTGEEMRRARWPYANQNGTEATETGFRPEVTQLPHLRQFWAELQFHRAALVVQTLLAALWVALWMTPLIFPNRPLAWRLLWLVAGVAMGLVPAFIFLVLRWLIPLSPTMAFACFALGCGVYGPIAYAWLFRRV